MVSNKKLELLKEIKRLNEEDGLTFRQISVHFGKKEAWAGVYFRRNKELLDSVDTSDTSDTDTSDSVDTSDTTVDTDPIISPPEPIEEAPIDDGPGFVASTTLEQLEESLSPRPPTQIPTYDEFMMWCKDHPEYIFAKYLWDRCEGHPKRPIRSDTMKVLDALRTMLQ